MDNPILARIREAEAQGPGARDNAAGQSPESSGKAETHGLGSHGKRERHDAESHGKGKPRDLEQARLTAQDLPAGDLIALFKERAESSGAEVFVAGEPGSMKKILAEIIPVDAVVAVAGREEKDLVPDSCRQMESDPSRKSDLFQADVAITDAALGVAETGSLLLEAKDHGARLLSLTAMLHVAILETGRILPDLMDLQEALDQNPKSGYTLITGPSKTADIELKLVKGVHGPARLCIILLPS